MATLPPGGGRRSASLGAGTSRSTTVVVGRAGRGYTIPTPITEMRGFVSGFALVVGIADFLLGGDALLQENGDDLLQEDGFRLLLEDPASFGLSDGTGTARGVGASLVDAFGSSSGSVTVSGVIEAPGGADNLLQEDSSNLLQEDGSSLILLETGVVTPGGVILDVNLVEITDVETGAFILEV